MEGRLSSRQTNQPHYGRSGSRLGMGEKGGEGEGGVAQGERQGVKCSHRLREAAATTRSAVPRRATPRCVPSDTRRGDTTMRSNSARLVWRTLMKAPVSASVYTLAHTQIHTHTHACTHTHRHTHSLTHMLFLCLRFLLRLSFSFSASLFGFFASLFSFCCCCFCCCCLCDCFMGLLLFKIL